MNQVNWNNIMMTLREIELVLGKELFKETVKGIRSGHRATIGKSWEHDQKTFDDLCCNLGYVPFFNCDN
jgi:hypothetical protein